MRFVASAATPSYEKSTGELAILLDGIISEESPKGVAGPSPIFLLPQEGKLILHRNTISFYHLLLGAALGQRFIYSLPRASAF